jgi:uncharacterized phage protein gp47/JayE
VGSYSPPSIGPAGLSVPTYSEILAMYTSSFLAIYGQNFNLDNSSPIEQLLSVLALAASDGNNALQQVYNNMSPATAMGAGLSLLVLLNGLQRLAASYSTCMVTLTGTPGAVINNGIIQNAVTSDLWNLPATVTIGGGGTISVTATAQAAGAINATASQLTVIVTPTFGWTSVTNGSNLPSVGQPVEADSALRIRQQQSVTLPSQTLGSGTIAAILAVPGVTRINNSPVLGGSGTTSFENWTGSTDSWGNPGHSISPVVEGGAALAIATAIYNNRGLGVDTNGSTGGTPVSTNITDPESGIVTQINFATPAETSIYVSLKAHALNGGSSVVLGPLIQAAIVAYLNTLQIGATVSFGELVAAANSVNTVPMTYSVQASNFFFGTSASPSTNTDITLSFYQAPQGITGDVVIAWV